MQTTIRNELVYREIKCSLSIQRNFLKPKRIYGCPRCRNQVLPEQPSVTQNPAREFPARAARGLIRGCAFRPSPPAPAAPLGAEAEPPSGPGALPLRGDSFPSFYLFIYFVLLGEAVPRDAEVRRERRSSHGRPAHAAPFAAPAPRPPAAGRRRPARLRGGPQPHGRRLGVHGAGRRGRRTAGVGSLRPGLSRRQGCPEPPNGAGRRRLCRLPGLPGRAACGGTRKSLSGAAPAPSLACCVRRPLVFRDPPLEEAWLA